MKSKPGVKKVYKKKEKWYGYNSKYNTLNLIRAQAILSWFDVHEPTKAAIEAAEEDVLGFINRECRALRISLGEKP